MDRQQAKHIIKNTGYIGNEVGVAFDVAIKSMDKLEQIEQIVNEKGNIWGASVHERLKKILEDE